MKLLKTVLAALLLAQVSLAADLPEAALGSMTVPPTDGVAQCQTATQCWNGRVISCWATGIQATCQRNSNEVLCQSWGSDGTYAVARDYCY